MSYSTRRVVIDCYEILGISPDATLRDINSAYKKLALKHHPDKTDGDEAIIEFQKIQQAVEILRDMSRRREHDEELGRRRGFYNQEDHLFASPEYTGWRPDDVCRSRFNRRGRYMYSYRNSVHMDPHSRDSQEELSRCAQEREEEEQQRIRQASYAFAEDSASEARNESVHAGIPQDENRRFGLKPEATSSEIPMDDGRYGHFYAKWWAGLYPEETDYPEFEAHTDADVEFACEAEPEFGSEGDAEVYADVYAELDNFLDRKEHPEFPGVDTRVDMETIADVDAAAHAYAPMESSGQFTADYHTASQGTSYDLDSDGYTRPYGPVFDSREDLEAYSTGKADSDSAASVYHDCLSQSSNTTGNDNDHNIYIDGNISTIPEYDFKFIGDVHPYLGPFIPFFTAKLAFEGGRYTTEDFHAEMCGMVMETYCGWLETIRATVPGADARATAVDPLVCLHLGYWEKGLGREECEVCHLWRPIYTLVCPGCGIKRCVGCKFKAA